MAKKESTPDIDEPIVVETPPPTFRDLTNDDVTELFTYHSPDQSQQEAYVAVREAAKAFVVTLIQNVPPSADRSAAIRDVRRGTHMALAAITFRGRY